MFGYAVVCFAIMATKGFLQKRPDPPTRSEARKYILESRTPTTHVQAFEIASESYKFAVKKCRELSDPRPRIDCICTAESNQLQNYEALIHVVPVSYDYPTSEVRKRVDDLNGLHRILTAQHEQFCSK
jgi:hypothetical protein